MTNRIIKKVLSALSHQALVRVMSALFFSLALMTNFAHSVEYPSGVVRIIVGFPPGNATDIVARVFAKQMSEAFNGAPFVVENMVGAAGSIGTAAVAKATPNGLTLLVGSVGTLAMNPWLIKNLPYDPAKDFVPLAQLASVPMYVTVQSTLPVNSFTDLVALAKQKPGVLNFGSSGNGSANHLIAAVVASTSSIDITHIPYKGSAPAVTDLLAGRLSLMVETAPAVLPHVKSGKLKILAVTKPTRTAILPDVLTLSESGYPGFDAQAWIGFAAPAGTPREILDVLGRTAAQVVGSKLFAAKMVELGLEPMASTSPAQFSSYLNGEIKRWGTVTERIGIVRE